ncbi:MAG: lactate utilization protein C, partial [Actinomycetota bacterium]|nr:lactate utilization protein C [Actinomycetota bacterium]
MSAREDVLTRVRRAVASVAPPSEPVRGYRARGAHPAGSPELLDLLQDRLVDYKARVRRTDEAGLPAAVADALRSG